MGKGVKRRPHRRKRLSNRKARRHLRNAKKGPILAQYLR